MDYREAAGRVMEYARKSEGRKRFEHSVRVAETAARMCSIYGLEPDRGYLAGIAHDICKDFGDDELVSLAASDGGGISGLERKKPSLLHGRAAAVILARDFHIDDSEIIEAVANHTFGLAGMSDLGKILYAADKIEPGRPQSTDEYRARLFSMPLDGLMRSVVEENSRYLESKGKEAAPATREFLLSLKGEARK